MQTFPKQKVSTGSNKICLKPPGTIMQKCMAYGILMPHKVKHYRPEWEQSECSFIFHNLRVTLSFINIYRYAIHTYRIYEYITCQECMPHRFLVTPSKSPLHPRTAHIFSYLGDLWHNGLYWSNAASCHLSNAQNLFTLQEVLIGQ